MSGFALAKEIKTCQQKLFILSKSIHIWSTFEANLYLSWSLPLTICVTYCIIYCVYIHIFNYLKINLILSHNCKVLGLTNLDEVKWVCKNVFLLQTVTKKIGYSFYTLGFCNHASHTQVMMIFTNKYRIWSVREKERDQTQNTNIDTFPN